MHEVTILRSRRKSLAIEIQRDGKILVRAPLRTAQSRIEALLREKNAWIEQKLAMVRQLQTQIPSHSFVSGEAFLYLGIRYPLRLVDRTRPALVLDGAFELAKGSYPRARDVFQAWYRNAAASYFQERMAVWSTRTGLDPTALGISSARTRWGSCSPSGKINLTWRLVMAPPAAIDYVIVHELAHLRVKNHSRSFWDLVRVFLPDYPAQRKWLKENGQQLDL